MLIRTLTFLLENENPTGGDKRNSLSFPIQHPEDPATPIGTVVYCLGRPEIKPSEV